VKFWSLTLYRYASDDAKTFFPSYPQCPSENVPIYPNQTGGNNYAYIYTKDPNHPNDSPSISRGYYKITKDGTLHVYLILYLTRENPKIQ
jgi:hypothetical protein